MSLSGGPSRTRPRPNTKFKRPPSESLCLVLRWAVIAAKSVKPRVSLLHKQAGAWGPALATLLYSLFILTIAWHHEPWADEAQAWLLARDASFLELWTRLLHYEGSPGLWHTLLMAMARAGLPYRSEAVLAGLLGLASAALILWRAPFPFAVRLLLPFTYFLAFQYVIVARSYSLLPVLLFSCLLLYPAARTHRFLFLALVALMACVSVHGLILSAALLTSLDIGGVLNWKQQSTQSRRRIALAALFFIALISVLALLTWPAQDVNFPARAQLSWPKFQTSLTMFLEQGFTGNVYITVLLIAASLPFLYQGGGLAMFALSALGLIGFGGIIYSQFWHTGTLFLAWLAAMWISASHTKLTRTALAAFLAIIGIQCFWTAKSSLYDLYNPYSGSKEAAAYLKSSGIARKSLLAYGYPCTAIQPYFKQSIFVNYAPHKAFWDWSVRNPMTDPSPLFAQQASEYAIVGYNLPKEVEWLLGPLKQSGYSKVKHFSGKLFWRTSPFEAEDFDLYRRVRPAELVPHTYLVLSDPSSARQLLSGFYALDANPWRWTAHQFTVLLRTPPAKSAASRMEVKLYLSPDQIRKLGPITLRAVVNGFALQPQTFTSPGLYTYSSPVPPEALVHESAIAKFSFDKSLLPSQADGRILGAVVTAVGLQTPTP